MRMLALAQALQHLGEDVHLATMTQASSLLDSWTGTGTTTATAIHRMQICPQGGAQDLCQTEALIAKLNVNSLVLDGYEFSLHYQSRIRARGRVQLTVVDDHRFGAEWDTDILLNQNFGAVADAYAGVDPRTVILAGQRMCLLRREFWGAAPEPARKHSSPLRILVTLGAGDPLGLVEPVVAGLCEASDEQLQIRVLAGALGGRSARHQESARGPRIEYLPHVSAMRPQYEWCDALVSAGGSSCLEWGLLGRPACVIPVADNQLPFVRHLAAAQISTVLSERIPTVQEVSDGVRFWVQSTPWRKGRPIPGLDSYGSLRVASILAGKLPILRPAGPADAARVLDWANDTASREASFHSGRISPEEHAVWWTSRLADPQTWLRIVEDREGTAIGIVRIEQAPEGPVFSINLDQSARGRGLGALAIEEATRQYMAERGATRVQAFIRTENTASERAFGRAGYRMEHRCVVAGQSATRWDFETVGAKEQSD